MPPESIKRRAVDITSQKPKKMQKIDESDEKKQMKDFDKKKREELEHALDKEDNDRVLKLGLEFMDWQMTSSNLAKRLQNFFVDKIRNQELVRRLLERQNPDLWTPMGAVLLWQAVKRGEIEIAKMLVRAGTDLSLRESTNDNTLLHAVLSSEKMEDQGQKQNLILLMLEHGADVDARDKYGFSILNRAIQKRSSTTFIEHLLQFGANVRIDDNIGMNDIFYALKYKHELVLRLIQHQVPNEEVRNRRGVIAIEYLIREKDCEKLKMIKDILDLGVPINNPDPRNPLGNCECSLLHSALDAKKLDVIKLLLENGADVHQKDKTGITPLYKAALLHKAYSHASRLLISHGASINECNSNNGRYPIHGACKNESLRNVHLLLSLGANLAVTDNKGMTPFDSMTIYNESLTDAGRLVIKHFALMVSNGIPLLGRDLIKINKCPDVFKFYNDCLEELDKMKTMIVYDDVSYFFLLSKNLKDRLLLVMNANFVQTFNENTQLSDSLCIYFYNLKISLDIAIKQLKILKFMEESLKDVFRKVFPIAVIEKIAYYASLKNMMNCEKLSFLSLHKDTKHNQLGKRMLI